jgi:transposase
VLDRNDMKVHYLVMDNDTTHSPVKLREIVESRDYKCMYLPPYSPCLNPIEAFWSKVNANIRRKSLAADNRRGDRIYEFVQMVTRAGCQAWIRHAVSFFPECKREDIL